MGSNFNTKIGIARATTASQVVAPSRFFRCQNAQVAGDPRFAESDGLEAQLGTYTALNFGKDFTFEISGAQLPIGQLGYLLWLMLGSDSYLDPNHTIIPAGTAQYACIQIDRGLNIPSNPTQVLVGAKIERLRLEVPLQGFASATISGKACDLDDPVAALTAAYLTGADNVPISYQALRSPGSISIGYGATASAKTNIKSLNLEWSRDLTDDEGRDLSGDQPTAINEGRLACNWEAMVDLAGAEAQAAYAGWLAGSAVELDLTFGVGSNTARLQFPSGIWTANFPEPIAANAEQTKGKIAVSANRNNGTGVLSQATVNDETTGAYT